jgi:ABC-type phosphate transport system substrate-binding protein
LRALALAPSLRDAAHLPTSENLHDGSYPLRLPLYVAFRREAAPRLLLFLRFLLSDEGADALATANFHALPVDARNQLAFELEALSRK